MEKIEVGYWALPATGGIDYKKQKMKFIISLLMLIAMFSSTVSCPNAAAQEQKGTDPSSAASDLTVLDFKNSRNTETAQFKVQDEMINPLPRHPKGNNTFIAMNLNDNIEHLKVDKTDQPTKSIIEEIKKALKGKPYGWLEMTEALRKVILIGTSEADAMKQLESEDFEIKILPSKIDPKHKHLIRAQRCLYKNKSWLDFSCYIVVCDLTIKDGIVIDVYSQLIPS